MPNQHQKTKPRKKKGHTPAHQNTFAFKHNPKSKLTEKILTAPNVGVCRRCRDKIEWRKKYRKYKPLTQPGRCNLCQRRGVVTAAYHTICSACAGGSVALSRLGCGGGGVDGDADGRPTGIRDEERDNVGEETDCEDDDASKENNDDGEAESGMFHCTPSHAVTAGSTKIRACAICVREPALLEEGDKSEQMEKKLQLEVSRLERRLGRSLKLRERKNLERKVKKIVSEDEPVRRRAQEEGGKNGTTTSVGDVVDVVDDGQEEEGQCTNKHSDERQHDGIKFKEIPEVDDPFLAAVGGADKLLTGDAYRRMLLERQQEC